MHESNGRCSEGTEESKNESPLAIFSCNKIYLHVQYFKGNKRGINFVVFLDRNHVKVFVFRGGIFKPLKTVCHQTNSFKCQNI